MKQDCDISFDMRSLVIGKVAVERLLQCGREIFIQQFPRQAGHPEDVRLSLASLRDLDMLGDRLVDGLCVVF
ncbi:hypothetical protein N7481_001440 [Penicillium waksmanii]|uniref:uncharacterized protein n=1 Tax=Penicillium waksmanii TaxID=69791 RepID=UPI002547A038|nr:uncharacterized protein N7481_001440 [Penicillium waksmanii]KAJ6001031.1 hypothetical protein N7481_001440 [Penicillium waksmanii]